MRLLLSISACFLALSLNAQVPQGIGYQGVATDSQGLELTNQSISVRASILSGAVDGEIQWQETHSTSTDDFGLFALTIGEGANTGVGQLASFSDIPWGENTYFLQIEMDASGGDDYILMGVNQMMSVPYALHAESAESAPMNFDSIVNYLLQDLTFLENITNILSDTIANTLAGDSVFISNVTNLNGGGCDFMWPDGIDFTPITIGLASTDTSYMVPAGTNLYITNLYRANQNTSYNLDTETWDIPNFQIDGKSIIASKYNAVNNAEYGNDGCVLHVPIIVGAGSVISNSTGYSTGINGFLVNASVEPVTVSLPPSNPSYTVPEGKRFVVLNLLNWSAPLYIGGATVEGYAGLYGVGVLSNRWNVPNDSGSPNNWFQRGLNMGLPLFINSNETITASGSATVLNGYLVDEDFFEGCD